MLSPLKNEHTWKVYFPLKALCFTDGFSIFNPKVHRGLHTGLPLDRFWVTADKKKP